jgi:hypothetical protein
MCSRCAAHAWTAVTCPTLGGAGSRPGQPRRQCHSRTDLRLVAMISLPPCGE